VQAKDGTQTGVTVLLPHGASRHILTYPGTITKLSIDDLDMDYLASSSHFHISSFFLLKRLRSELPAVCRRLKSKGLTISLDTNDDPEDRWGDDLIALLPEIDVLLPNQDEACRMSGQKNLNDAVNWLADRVRTVVVKCGAEGAVVQSAGERFAVPPVPVIPVDTVGAGDSFDAGFLSCFIAHGDLAECAALGNLAAALSTLRSGGTEAFRERELAATFLRRRT
jgi:sugar/nucleoside kinase (ribokinase family)